MLSQEGNCIVSFTLQGPDSTPVTQDMNGGCSWVLGRLRPKRATLDWKQVLLLPRLSWNSGQGSLTEIVQARPFLEQHQVVEADAGLHQRSPAHSLCGASLLPIFLDIAGFGCP